MSNCNTKSEITGSIKDRITTVARKLFVEKGYHNTSIPEIVKEANVSIGALYHHFISKEELARYIHENAVKEFITRYNNEVKNKPDAREKIRAYTRMMFKWTEEDPVMVEYLLYGRPKEVLDKCMSVCSEEGLTVVFDIVNEGFKKGELRPQPVFTAAASISGVLIRMIELRLDGIINTPLDEVVDFIADNIWFSIKA